MNIPDSWNTLNGELPLVPEGSTDENDPVQCNQDHMVAGTHTTGPRVEHKQFAT